MNVFKYHTYLACVHIVDELFESLALELWQPDRGWSPGRGRRHRTTGYATYLTPLHRLKALAPVTPLLLSKLHEVKLYIKSLIMNTNMPVE